jgi:lipooligosaccharide transport system permease protein
MPMSTAAVSTPPALREFTYWMYRYRRIWRATAIISVANPLLFLTAIGAGLGTLVDRSSSPYLHGASYLQFFAPGLLAAASMQTAWVEAAGPVFQSRRKQGNYRAGASTAMRPEDLYTGHLLFMVFRVALSAVLFTAVALAFGVVTPARALPLAAAATLIGAAFAAPIAAWVVTVTRFNRLNSTFRFVILPMYMFSGTFYSPDQLPHWLHAVISVTPLYHGVQLCRALSTGTVSGSLLAVDVPYLAVMAAAGYLVGRVTYRRSLYT